MLPMKKNSQYLEINCSTSLRRKAATGNMLQIIEAHTSRPVYADVFEHPPPRLASRRPIWSDICRYSYAVERGLVVGFCAQPHYCYPTIRQSGFHLPRHTWSLMNRFRTGQGPCLANLHKWGLAQSPSWPEPVASDRP